MSTYNTSNVYITSSHGNGCSRAEIQQTRESCFKQLYTMRYISHNTQKKGSPVKLMGVVSNPYFSEYEYICICIYIYIYMRNIMFI